MRPSVEDLLPKVLEASRLTGDAGAGVRSALPGIRVVGGTRAGDVLRTRRVGAYRSLEMIGAAGIDFIYIDQTNFNGGRTPDDIMSNIEIITIGR